MTKQNYKDPQTVLSEIEFDNMVRKVMKRILISASIGALLGVGINVAMQVKRNT